MLRRHWGQKQKREEMVFLTIRAVREGGEAERFRLAWLQTGKLQNTTESAHLLLGLAEVRVHAIVEGAHPGNEARLGTHIRTKLLQHPLEVQPTFEARIQLGEVVHEL